MQKARADRAFAISEPGLLLELGLLAPALGGRLRRYERGVGIDEVSAVWSQAELNDGARVRDLLGLPAIVALVANHRFLGASVPGAGGVALQVMVADQR